VANFSPLKQRFLLLLKHSVRLLDVRGRFVDFGCGSGDVAEFLAALPEFSSGVGYDPMLTIAEIAQRSATRPAGVEYCRLESSVPTDLDLAVLFDVIEHVPAPGDLLSRVAAHVRERGWLILTVPYNAREWGPDDDFYGHLRRLSREGVIALLENHGWSVIRVLDPTFPSFWLIRKVFLASQRLAGRLGRKGPVAAGTDEERSLASSRQSAWGGAERVARLLASSLMPWQVIRAFDLYFESVFLGFELFVVCQRRSRSRTCEVCENGFLSHHAFFDRYSLQQCRYCRSQVVLPEPTCDEPPRDKHSKLRPAVAGVRSAVSSRRSHLIRALPTPEPSLLDVHCGRGELLSHLRGLGWRVKGTVAARDEAEAARGRGLDVVNCRPSELTEKERFGAVSIFHGIERAAHLGDDLGGIDRALMPGGLLVVEYPNGRSLLRRLLGARWFGFDPPYHRLLVNPRFLADRLGLMNYQLVSERHFSWAYSFFIFGQSLANLLLPFQRDALYHAFFRERLGLCGALSVILSLPVFLAALPLFVVFQPCASLVRGGCIVRQVYRKTDTVLDGSRTDASGTASAQRVRDA
jgi:2-polyprenyl-3-methyl-5-hydroxy-6-metoxy-1,4-benzoquinol methylase